MAKNNLTVAQANKNINVNTVILIAGGFIGLSVVTKILASFNLWTGPGGQAANNEAANPHSAWKPAFWKSAPIGTHLMILTKDDGDNLIKIIYHAFTVFQDDFNAIFNVFSLLKTKSQVSYLSDLFQKKYNNALLTFLQDGGGIMPWDGLSDGHMKILMDLVKNLPNYSK